jgi:hypothetical protein
MEPKEIPKAFLHESLERERTFFLKIRGHCPYIGYHAEEMLQVGRKWCMRGESQLQFNGKRDPGEQLPDPFLNTSDSV